MKKILLASVAALATVSAFSAFAADLPSRKAAPVYAPPPPMWTGFYAGLNAGYSFGTETAIENAGGVAANRTASTAGFLNNNAIGDVIAAPVPGLMTGRQYRQGGFMGGGQVGYNYQYGSSFLLGVEADIQGAGTRGALQATGFGAGSTAVGPLVGAAQPGTLSSRVGSVAGQYGVDWLGTVRGRVGYLWTPSLLIYGTGGFAYGNAFANVVSAGATNISTSTNILGPGAVAAPLQTNTAIGGGRQSQILTGWTAGGGAEWMFMPNWSLKAEALYWNLGNMNVQSTVLDISGRTDRLNNGISAQQMKVNYQGIIARAGVNYHFNWGAAPVVASY